MLALGLHRSLIMALAALTLVVSGCATIDSDEAAEPGATVEADAPDQDTDAPGDEDSPSDAGDEDSPSDAADDESAAKPTPKPTKEPAATTDSDDADAAMPEQAVTPLVLPDFVSLETTACGYAQLIPVPETPECLALTVPENWDDPDASDVVVLPIAVFAATGANPAAEPMVYLEGGPGGHSLDNLQFAFDGLVAPHLEDRSVIAFDQRGAGLATPSLFCQERVDASVETSKVANPYEDEAAVWLAALTECRDRLIAEGIDLTRYNSISSAKDVEALRQMLGHDQFDLLGISYGTRLAQTIMRMYPDMVRSVVLDSVVPTSAEIFSELSSTAEDAFTRLFDSCAADVDCAAAFPDLEARYFALADQLDAEPAEITVQDPFTLDELEAVMSGADLIGATFQSLYNRQIFASIPQLVADAETGDFGILESLAAQAYVQRDSLSEGMLLSVQCNEDLSFDDRANLAPNTPTEPGYDRFGVELSASEMFDSCEIWPSGTAPAIEDELVISDIPTLLIGGAFDPVTPVKGLDEIAAGLSTSWSIVFPSEGHGIAPTPCGAQIVRSFLASPGERPDDSCVADAPAPAFTPGSGGPVTLVEFEATLGAQSIRGVRPEGWLTQGPGVYARTENIEDPTLLLVQSVLGVPVGLLQTLLADSLSDAVGEDFVFAEAESRQTDNNIWDVFEATTAELEIRLFVNEAVFVVVMARVDEYETLDAELFGPFLNEIELTG